VKVAYGDDLVAQVEIEDAGTRHAGAKKIVEPYVVDGSGPGSFGKGREDSGRLPSGYRHRDLRA
jgi:hypothetical protein